MPLQLWQDFFSCIAHMARSLFLPNFSFSLIFMLGHINVFFGPLN